MLQEMNESEQRIYYELKSRVFKAIREFYTEAGVKLSQKERIIILCLAGRYVEEIMETLKEMSK